LIEIALYQPDIPQNTGTILRTAACLGTPVHIIEPAGFRWSLASFRRAGMDYIEHVNLTRHNCYDDFVEATKTRRIVLATTKTTKSYLNFEFQSGDIILFGRESAGVPQSVHDNHTNQITIKMQHHTRSLNIAVSAAMISAEALRQVNITT